MDASKLQREKPEDVIAIDWRQIALNGGPSCFFIEGPQYCGRAERWQGHGNAAFHDYVSLNDLLITTRLEAAREAREEAFKEAVKIVERLKCPPQFEGNWRNGYSHAQNDAFRAIEAAASTEEATIE